MCRSNGVVFETMTAMFTKKELLEHRKLMAYFWGAVGNLALIPEFKKAFVEDRVVVADAVVGIVSLPDMESDVPLMESVWGALWNVTQIEGVRPALEEGDAKDVLVAALLSIVAKKELNGLPALMEGVWGVASNIAGIPSVAALLRVRHKELFQALTAALRNAAFASETRVVEVLWATVAAVAVPDFEMSFVDVGQEFREALQVVLRPEQGHGPQLLKAVWTAVPRMMRLPVFGSEMPWPAKEMAAALKAIICDPLAQREAALMICVWDACVAVMGLPAFDAVFVEVGPAVVQGICQLLGNKIYLQYLQLMRYVWAVVTRLATQPQFAEVLARSKREIFDGATAVFGLQRSLQDYDLMTVLWGTVAELSGLPQYRDLFAQHPEKVLGALDELMQVPVPSAVLVRYSAVHFTSPVPHFTGGV